jgi:hypothetical protein
MIYVKRAAIRAMTANQAQAQAQIATQVVQPQVDGNQQAQSTEIKDVAMSDANTENAQGEGEKGTPIIVPLLTSLPRSEWHSHTIHHPSCSSVRTWCCVGSSTWCLGSYRRSEPDSEDGIPTPDPLHGNVG